MNTGEDHLVSKISKALYLQRVRRASDGGLRLGIGDDAALIAPTPGYETILTCDWFLEGSHFLRDKHPADSIGWKCLARAVSDIAAMGGRPTFFLLSLGLPKTHIGRWLDQFLGGLRRAARRLGCQLAGGDTTRNERILINVTVVGEIRHGRAVLRSGAKPGDLIFVSGRIGEAELGLQRLRQGQNRRHDPCVRKHLYPEPRLALGQWLAEKGFVTAMMDLSDGLSSDLARLCAASRVGARIEADNLPSPKRPAGSHSKSFDALRLALNGGDDYELLFTLSPPAARRIPKSHLRIPLTCIGQITVRRHLILRTRRDEQTLIPQGWDPLR